MKFWLEDWEDIDSDEEMECEDTEVMDDIEEEETGEVPPLGAIPITDCLFCPHHSSSLMKNVAHMTKIHSFFIPDIEYLSDLKGLIKYLGKYSGLLFNGAYRVICGQGILILCFSSIFDLTTCLFSENHKLDECFLSCGDKWRNLIRLQKTPFIFFPQIILPGEKVGVGKICLWCNEKGKSFYSTEAVQAHMNDKSHCKLFTDGDAALEFADFYDFR